MRMIAPRTGADEVTIAEDQLEYKPLVAAIYVNEQYGPDALTLLTRWTFTPEERAAIAAGEDVYLGVLTFGKPLQPLSMQVGAEGYTVGPDSQRVPLR